MDAIYPNVPYFMFADDALRSIIRSHLLHRQRLVTHRLADGCVACTRPVALDAGTETIVAYEDDIGQRWPILGWCDYTRELTLSIPASGASQTTRIRCVDTLNAFMREGMHRGAFSADRPCIFFPDAQTDAVYVDLSPFAGSAARRRLAPYKSPMARARLYKMTPHTKSSITIYDVASLWEPNPAACVVEYDEFITALLPPPVAIRATHALTIADMIPTPTEED